MGLESGKVLLGLVIKGEEIVGAYLDYSTDGHGYKPINYTEYMMKI